MNGFLNFLFLWLNFGLKNWPNGFMWQFNLFEVTGFVSGLIGVWLATRQNVWTWPVGLISVLTYTIFFYQLKLYADMGLQVFYIGSSFYGWYEWLRGGKNHSELPVTKLSLKTTLLSILSGAIFTVILSFYFKNFTDASYPVLDSALAAYSLVGQFLLTRKKIENWVLWFVVDAVYVGLYWAKDAHLTAALYFIFLILSVKGYMDWKRELKPVSA